jgi:hypothetical protein
MIAKPLFSIDKFSGMTDDGGMYYLDGFSVEKESGASSLDENYFTNELLNSSTTNFTGFNCVAMTVLMPLTGSNLNAETVGYKLMINDIGYFYTRGTGTVGSGGVYRGRIGGSSSSGTYRSSFKPDLFQLPSGNVLWTSKLHTGVMYRGLVMTGSSTTKIVDTAGRNFSTLGMSTSAPNNKVTNLVTGSEYTVTSITATNSTGDTLNFTTSGNSNTANDEFIAFVYDKFNLNTGVTIPTFQGQLATQEDWQRPIQQYGDQYLILNGNYLALLANDETTIDQTYKQLPVTFQGIDLKVNGSEILVSAYDNQNRAYLLLWNGHTDGWNEITPIDKAPNSLKAYSTGWIYLADGVVAYTDGRNIQKLIAVPDYLSTTKGGNTYSHNGIVILNDIFYFAYVTGNHGKNRDNNSVMVFNKKTGLTFFKCKSLSTEYAYPYCIYSYPNNSEIDIGAGESLNNLTFFVPNTSSAHTRNAVFFLDFKEEQKIGEVWLNIKYTSKTYYALDTTYVGDITVSVGNGNYGLASIGQIASNTTTTCANTAGAIRPATVGQEIEFTSGANAGQRTFITSIASGGSSSEVWTVSPALTNTSASSSNCRVWQLKKQLQKTISATDLSKPVRFPTNFIGDKMYLEVTIRGNANAMPISIQNIMLF